MTSSKTVLLHLGHLWSSSESITYIRQRGQPTSIMEVASSGLAGYSRDSLGSDDKHDVGGESVGDRLGGSSRGRLRLGGDRFSFRKKTKKVFTGIEKYSIASIFPDREGFVKITGKIEVVRGGSDVSESKLVRLAAARPWAAVVVVGSSRKAGKKKACIWRPMAIGDLGFEENESIKVHGGPWLIAIEDLLDAVLEAKEEVEVAEADVYVNGDEKEAEAREGEANLGSCAGLPPLPEVMNSTRGVSSESCRLQLCWRRAQIGTGAATAMVLGCAGGLGWGGG
ncbi:alpha-trehalose-phosphate synthase [Striga asiatica]|uniref:Alpha-trehalose-phosphate synthase n=1 Tax=Striga asiatica TaxID=4170 RepID=A0A5A7P877_STRAF|nr:alpha-trehalose-phosphate synthase [Striga asiatica]